MDRDRYSCCAASREKTGKGSIINTSLLETALNWNAAWVNAYVNTGVEAKRMGTAFGNLVPYQTFEAADDAIVIAAGNDRLFAKLAESLGHPEWIADPRYATNRDRMDNRDDIIGKINDVLKTKPRAYWQEKFTAVGVPNSPVNSISQAANDPQNAGARDHPHRPRRGHETRGVADVIQRGTPAARSTCTQAGRTQRPSRNVEVLEEADLALGNTV